MVRLASILIAATLVLAPSTGFARVEKETGTNYDESLKPADATKSLKLMGVGVREKTIFNVNIYALGYYLDADAAKTALAAFKGKDAKALGGDAEFRKLALGDSYEAACLMVMSRDVDGEDMGDAFDGSLKPRIEKLGGGAAGLDALKKFRGYFSIDEVKEGVKLLFLWKKGGKLTSYMDGKKLGEIDSLVLSQALFDTWIGADPVSAGAKRSIMKGFEKLLKAE